MKIHEYQARDIFRRAGIRVPDGEAVSTAADARRVAERIGVPVMVKSQVHVGGRGKAGGIRHVPNLNDVERVAGEVLGMKIKGLEVKKVLISKAVDIATEAYVGMILDRDQRRLTFLVSPAGGIDIEEVARTSPEKIFRYTVDPNVGLRPYAARWLASRLYDDPKLVKEAAAIIAKMYVAFLASDASLAEINPLITTPSGEVWAIDSKINVDDSGLFRQTEIEKMRDLDAELPAETLARENGLSYVPLEGNIGCVVNGAGLAMTTMDVIKHYGGEPANFLDIGGSSSPDKVVAALDILTSDPKVGAILFNIFGGITRCDDVAVGIRTAFEKRPMELPIVIRLTGTNEKRAKEILEEAGYTTLTGMDEAVREVVKAAEKGGRS
ncbi:MAG: ADP-forming succinate--CoA ligase subunit beta [Candidatus Eisenbacteria bacterium]